ncbi:glycosyltransferase family 4 protein [Catenovulum sp. 2E275]|uniref:glycosyltransferase family 4 protein n=1 Tax=Catenovulum sp. 2E275 TaxID=2980497 RepID=UPI0021D3D861|nr:glycosyltransferase family 4 protein [Catenovulum sp. 2E275]MCU4674826.1 glycosyltransferase family 4 protein [Catenovulum sp. 2E275]
MKVAIIHDWLVVNGGAEKVLEEILALYPDADIYTLVDYLPQDSRDWLKGNKVYTSFIQKLPFAKTQYRNYFPFFPLAIEQFDLSAYDLIVSSSYCVAKGVITSPEQTHVSYCHSPARYAWDLQAQYLKESGLTRGLKSMIVRYFLHKFRIWDIRTANGVDLFIANSKFIKKRIFKCYRREAEVINPPVNLSQFQFCGEKQDYYLTASRLVPYKRIDLVIEAFTKMPDKKLKVIGDGPEMEKLKRLAQGHSNIELMGFQSNQVLIKTMQGARAFVFAAEEDFGIIPVEAQACGTPVIAYGKGGSLETVSAGVSGIHFEAQTVESLTQAVHNFESSEQTFDYARVRQNAEKFSVESFRQNLENLIVRTQEANG